MRALSALVVTTVILALVPTSSQAGGRFGVALDTKKYPQATPREALASVIKAALANEYGYIAAQLADPAFVDERVKKAYGGRFEEQVEDLRSALGPAAVKVLDRFLSAGKWSVGKAEAVAELEGVRDRCVRLVQKDGRWFLAHRWDLPEKK